MRIGVILVVFLLLLGCGQQPAETSAGMAEKQKTYHWKLVTTWPKNYPGLGTAPENFANKVAAMSDGRLTIKVFGAGSWYPHLRYLMRLVRALHKWGMAPPIIGQVNLRPQGFSPPFPLV